MQAYKQEGIDLDNAIIWSANFGDLEKPSNVRHGCKNAYFWKIQKRGPSDHPWASKSKKTKDLDQPKINAIVFKKVGKKMSISGDFIKN